MTFHQPPTTIQPVDFSFSLVYKVARCHYVRC
jgi:hypothetical protein